MATIDLKEAYLLVPIKPEFRKFLRFHFKNNKGNNVTYEFKAMPYGLSIAPRVFTKLMKEVIASLRRRGFKSVIYLDDILCIGKNYTDCLNNINETIKLLSCLGFVINLEKSSLTPRQECKFLGFIYNTCDLTLSLPVDKRNNIAHIVNKFSKLPVCTIREFSHLIGVLVAACPAIKYGWLYTKILERQKYLFLKQHNSNYDSKVMLPCYILSELNWWSQHIYNKSNFMKTPNFTLEIFSDASRTGWGGFCNGKRVHGSWKECEKIYHINYLELLATFLTLKVFAKTYSNCAILLWIDNNTAVSNINRMGGIQFPHLNKLTKQLWQWCENRNIWLFASYINTKDNVDADKESRRINPDIEWSLSNEMYQNIVRVLGEPDIDLFASRTNTKCKTYVSWHPDPDASCVDAFTINWHNINFYAFPPFTLILRCLQKIVNDEACGILVFPCWPSQPWFPLARELISSDIMYFKADTNLTHSHSSQLSRPLHSHLTLAAARLSVKPSYGERSHRKLSN
ncbi:unnamed protein product [Euphydryas editha]|uniref:Reverse transcriptase domain-containing protein n=1 Tax=Euphydryas editha TaxID=104508 RepID=A0AAU9UKZ2_EUPED|nr:unnamed protein product [Euphydryas editha]